MPSPLGTRPPLPRSCSARWWWQWNRTYQSGKQYHCTGREDGKRSSYIYKTRGEQRERSKSSSCFKRQHHCRPSATTVGLLIGFKYCSRLIWHGKYSCSASYGNFSSFYTREMPPLRHGTCYDYVIVCDKSIAF